MICLYDIQHSQGYIDNHKEGYTSELQNIP